MRDLSSILMGTQSKEIFLGLIFFALIGVLVSLLLQTTTRNVNSDRSPFYFRWAFFLRDNLRRIIAGILLIYIALRFTPEIFGFEINDFTALLIGFLNDKIAQALKNKTNILGTKLNS